MANTPVKLNDGHTIPWLGFGTGTALFKQDVTQSVTDAIAAGFTHLDGAQMYANEDSLGAAIAASGKPRSELFVTTKFGALGPGRSVRDALVEALGKLKMDYVDLFLIHSPVEHPREALRGMWKEMEVLKVEGLARSIGVSNFREKELEIIMEEASVVPAVNQIELHPHLYAETKPLLDFHVKHGIVTVSYSGLSPLFRTEGNEVNVVAKSIAEQLAKTASVPVNGTHVLLLWSKHKGVVPITTTKRKERLVDYLNIDKVPDLTAEDVAAIDEAGSKASYRYFPLMWPTD